MRPQDYGVAPVWRATGDGDYAIPAGYRCIGFRANVAGNVVFKSEVGGADLTFAVEAGVPYTANVISFEADSTTATGIHAALVKG